MDVLIATSVGGHLTEILPIAKCLETRGHRIVWAVNDHSPVLPKGVAAHRITHGERDLGVLRNCLELASIIDRERPDVLLSAGASPAVSAALVARAVGLPVVYVEPSSSVTRLTLTGRLMRRLANRFFVQWPGLLDLAPEATYAGGLL